MKNILKYISIFALVIIIFNVFMLLGSLFPSSLIEENVKESAEILLKEGNAFKFKTPILLNNNYTDSIMINTAYSIDNKNPVYSYMSARKNYKKGQTKKTLSDIKRELISVDSTSEPDVYNPVGELSEFVDGKIDTSITYARYWHGYLPILRVLLIFFNISEIRLLNLILFIFLLIYFAVLLSRKLGKNIAFIFIYSFLIYAYLHVSYSLENTPIFLTMMISSIILLKRIEKIKDFSIFIFIVGCIASFVDFLTVPLITLAIPLFIYILYNKKIEKEIKLKSILKYIILWGIGYFITWFSKWVIYDLLYNEGLIKLSINQFFYRSGSEDDILILLSLFIDLINIYLFQAIMYILTYEFVHISYLIITKKIENYDIKFCDFLNNNLLILIVSFLPFVWYSVLRNHSTMHWHFTFRHMIIFTLGILLYMNNALKKKE